MLDAQDLSKIKDVKSVTKKKPIEFGGAIGLGAGYYRNSSNQERMAPWNWYVSGSPFVKFMALIFLSPLLTAKREGV